MQHSGIQIRNTALSLVVAALLAVAGCGHEPSGVTDETLAGTWSFSQNAGVWGLLAGRITFQPDGRFVIRGTAVLPSGGFEERVIEGEWQQSPSYVRLAVMDTESNWRTQWQNDAVEFMELAGEYRWFRLFKPGPD